MSLGIIPLVILWVTYLLQENSNVEEKTSFAEKRI